MAKSKRFKKVYCEISGGCNFSCDFCPLAHDNHSFAQSFMERSTFLRVLDQLAPLTERLYFHIMGEPLLHPLFNEYIELCEQAGVKVHLVTNGALINENTVKGLLSPAVREINFSLQSFAGSYGEDADDTVYLQRIFEFIDLAQKERPDVYINLRLWNLDGYEEARSSNFKMLEKIYAHFGLEVPEFKVGKKIHGRSVPVSGVTYVNFSTRFAWPSMKLPEMRSTGYCMGLMTQLGVHNDGTVVPCCLDDNAEINLGNLLESSIEEILESPRAKEMFDGFNDEVLTEALCKRCAFGARFKKRVRVRGKGV